MNYHDTIVAQATPPGRGGIGILRVSGLQAREVAAMVLGKLPKPRYADYLTFKDVNGTMLDQGIALWFPAPNSFTGEDILELHGHGGAIVLDLLLKSILTIPGIRIAKPGEFSERAFCNDKLDLTQAEAIVDLINAGSELAARSAINSLQGVFSTRINHLLDNLTDLRINIEALINFPDEENEFFLDQDIKTKIDYIIQYLDDTCASARYGNILREGLTVVIAGCPNAGKSSLMNALVGREIAIVTDIAGTTRDVLHEYIYIDGVPIHIVDTAGLRDITNDKIELMGIERAWHEIKQADLVLFVIDSTTTDAVDPLDIYPQFILNLLPNISVIVIRNKIDITGENYGLSKINNKVIIRLSVHTGEGIDILRNYLKQSIGFKVDMTGSGLYLARRRHLQALQQATIHLMHCKNHFINSHLWSGEILMEDLRLAHQALSEITGKFTSDDLLSEIFSKFCIGK